MLKDRDKGALGQADEVEEQTLHEDEEALDQDDVLEEHSFDELARGLAEDTFSRAQALKYAFASILGTVFGGGALGLLPEFALAKGRKRKKLVCLPETIKVCKKTKGHKKCTCVPIPSSCTANQPCPGTLCCVNGSCVSCPSGETCVGTAPTQTCSSGGCNPPCTDDTICVNGQCVACGATGEICCAGNTCPVSGTCTNGVCQPSGGCNRPAPCNGVCLNDICVPFCGPDEHGCALAPPTCICKSGICIGSGTGGKCHT